MMWAISKAAESNKIHSLVILVPGWSFILMGWIGLVGERIVARMKQP